jgi:fido (protein-threonine AMPylation protein)
MESVEQDLLLHLYEGMFINGAEHHRLTVAEVIEWHWRWLECVYPWAGEVRRFNLSKGNFAFASAHWPVSMAVELATARIIRYRSGTRPAS